MAKAPYSASAQALPHRMSRLFTEIRWILQVALGVFLLMALVSYSRHDPSWTHAAQVDQIANWAGRVGAWTADILLLLFGLSAYWWVVLLVRRIIANYRRITNHEAAAMKRRERSHVARRGVRVRAGAGRQRRYRSAADVVAQGAGAARAGRRDRRGGRARRVPCAGFHRRHAVPADRAGDRLVAVFQLLLAVRLRKNRRRHHGHHHRREDAPRSGPRPQAGRSGGREARRQGGARAREDRGAGAGDDRAAGRAGQIGAGGEGKAGAAFHRSARRLHAAAAGAARRRAGSEGNHFRRYARIHVAADREEAEGFRRGSEPWWPRIRVRS